MFGIDNDFPALGVVAEEPNKAGSAPIFKSDPVIQEALKGSYVQHHHAIPQVNPCGEIVMKGVIGPAGERGPIGNIGLKEQPITFSDFNKLLDTSSSPLRGIVFDNCGFISLPIGRTIFYGNEGEANYTPHHNGDVKFSVSTDKVKTQIAEDGKWIDFKGSDSIPFIQLPKFNEYGNEDEDTTSYTEEEIDDIKEEAYDNGFDDGKREGYDDGMDDGKREGYQEGYDEGLRDGAEEYKENLELDDVKELIEEYISDGDAIEFDTIEVDRPDENISRIHLKKSHNLPRFYFIDREHPVERESDFEWDFEYDRDRVITSDGNIWFWHCDQEEWKKLVEHQNTNEDARHVKTSVTDEGNFVVETRDGTKVFFVDGVYSSKLDDTEDFESFDTEKDCVITSDGDIAQWDEGKDGWTYLRVD